MAQGFHYKRVELYKTEVLGIGSYGAVCRAMCDDLPCAAKILHSTLFQFNDPGAMNVLQRFEQECYFLNAIRHPHIVQYLGTYRDPESRLPVLLMEIMEQSLTRYLEQSKEPLPYHTQVNLCYDTALALSYLHSNDIIHRDLSSNNVLLVAGSRAKVTDFGMAKLFDINLSMAPMTMCPGTSAYMSPEALRDPPVYNKKLDCFSFGVLDIQIITRQFPDPDPAVQIVEDSRYPMGRVQVLVPETDRRRSHISLIDPGHPLLLIATDCLSYNAEDRPSAHDLCNRLATLKVSTHYDQSVQQAKGKSSSAQMAAAERECSARLIRELQEEREQHIETIQALQQQTVAKDNRLQEKETTVLRQLDKIRGMELQLAQKTNNADVQEEKALELNQHMVTELQQNLLQNQQERIERLEQMLAGGIKGVKVQLKWKQGGKVPEMMNRGASAVIRRMGYFKSSGSPTIRACDFTTEQWSVLPECPHSDFSLVVVNNFLTAVGGELSGEPTNTLLSLVGQGEDRKWLKIYPPMPTKRFRTTAVCSETSLVVAGGAMSIFSSLTTVEVMNMETLQWCTAGCLPHPFPDASATICGGHVYLLGGWDEDGSETKLALTCSLSRLSSQPTLSPADQPSVWQAVADVPVYLSTTASIKGQLLAIGGLGEDRMPTNLVHKYDPENNSWEIISHMRMARYWPLVAVLPSSELTVVGGKTKTGTWTDAVEIGSDF